MSQLLPFLLVLLFSPPLLAQVSQILPNVTSPLLVSVTTKVAGDPFFGTGYPSEFTINGLHAPNVTLYQGVTYSFSISTTSLHPWYIGTDSTGQGAGLLYAGLSTGTFNFTPSAADAAKAQLYYECENHAMMGNTIFIAQPPQPSQPAVPSSSSAASSAAVRSSSSSSAPVAASSSSAAAGSSSGTVSSSAAVSSSPQLSSSTPALSSSASAPTSAAVVSSSAVPTSAAALSTASSPTSTLTSTRAATSAPLSSAIAATSSAAAVTSTAALASSSAPLSPTGALPPPSSTTTFNVGVTAKVASDPFFGTGFPAEYTVNGAHAPVLSVTRGVTYTFNVNVSSIHPLYIGTDPVGESSGMLSPPVGGVFLGSFTWTPTSATPATLYYQCENHPNMGNAINVAQGPTTGNDAATQTTASVTGIALVVAVLTLWL